MKKVPTGALIFEKYGAEEIEYTLQIGTHKRIALMADSDNGRGNNASDLLVAYPSFLTEGLRRIIQQSKLTQAVCKNHPSFPYLREEHLVKPIFQLVASVPALSSYSITQGIRVCASFFANHPP